MSGLRVGRVLQSSGQVALGVVTDGGVRVVPFRPPVATLADILHAADPVGLVRTLLGAGGPVVPEGSVKWLAPIDRQEVWAAGVTYKRSQVARMEESETGASHYDRVYTAPRPEIFFKANAGRVSGPGEPVRIRVDTKWSVPEPEFALVISPAGRLVGLTIGNDMSARDIEGENPLYLPQAKVYNQCCGLGPSVLLAGDPLDRQATRISLKIERGGGVVFAGETNLDQMKRTFEELIDWLFRDNSFPEGAILLTGTGVVPPNEFTLAAGDVVSISVTGLGTLVNPVVQG
jgi:2-dehydro-3-deoxy-D-arabinonate dehydratase